MKTTDRLTHLIAVIFALCSLTSCSDDDTHDETTTDITGLWYAPNATIDGVAFRTVYNFINSNTVADYSTVSSSPNGWLDETSTIPGHPGWYYAPSAARNYTYYVIGNKIYITNGTIFTVSGDRLLEDGSGKIWQRW